MPTLTREVQLPLGSGHTLVQELEVPEDVG